MRRSRYIKTPIHRMTMTERIDMATDIANSCDFVTSWTEMRQMVAVMVNAMNAVCPFSTEPQEEEGS